MNKDKILDYLKEGLREVNNEHNHAYEQGDTNEKADAGFEIYTTLIEKIENNEFD